MSKSPAKSLTLYVAAWQLKPTDSSAKAVTPTLLSFSAPDYGIMFRCRVVCDPADGIATAAVTGLRFLEVSLKSVAVEEVTLAVDSPAFFFQVTGHTAVKSPRGTKVEMLRDYRKKYKLDFKLIESVNNPARHNCHGLPTTPADVTPPLVYSPMNWSQGGKMMPLQNGIKL